MKESPFIVISQTNPDPMYKQVTDQIINAIARGIIRTGDKLPSVRNMVEELNISAITVKRAYADLENEGYILTRAGLGTFVSDLDRKKLKREKLQEIRKEIKKILNSARNYGITREEIIEEIRGITGPESKEK
jgi:GntR family transcriptional regulator